MITIAHQSIKNKLLLINMLAMVMAGLVSGGFWVLIPTNNQIEYLDQRLSSQAMFVSNHSSKAIISEDWSQVEALLSELSNDPAVMSASVRSEKSLKKINLTFRDAPQQRRTLAVLFEPLRERQGNMSLPVLANGQQIATVQVTYHTNEIYDTFVELVIALNIAGGSAFLLSFIFLSYLQTFVTRPLNQLSGIARRVTETSNYSLRSKVVYRDEVGELAKDFNSMLEIIEQRDSDLEEKVKERTHALERKNDELQHQIAERERAQKLNREMESRFEQAFHSAPIGTALIDKNQKVIRVNRTFSQMLDVDINNGVSLQDFIDEPAYGHISQFFPAMVEGKEAHMELEAECFDQSGNVISSILSFSPLRDASKFRWAVMQLQDVTESKRMSEELEFHATHDALTALPNRRVLKEALCEASEAECFKPYALCILDLDQFKVVNDSCGHMAGDELLRQVSQVIRRSVRSDDVVARLGGDEFAVLIQDGSAEAVSKVTESIRTAVEHWEYSFEGKVFRVGASIGVVIVDRPNLDVSELMNQADAACFVAKDLGRNRVHIVDQEDDNEVYQRRGEMRWVQRIHDALESDKFILYSQPVVPLASTCESKRQEILLRMWDDETGCIVPPGSFMPAAERYSLIDKIDHWVVNNVIKLLEENKQLFEGGQSYWINLSGLSLGNKKFLEGLEAMVKASSLPNGTINFEITETAVMGNIAAARQFMAAVKALGCRFALDDFGSGMSSFGYLKNLPVDYIKIDGMFVRDILKDEIDFIFVKSIIDIAKVMGIGTVAEYVETEEIRDALEALGTDFGQGFGLGYPKPLINLDQNLDGKPRQSIAS